MSMSLLQPGSLLISVDGVCVEVLAYGPTEGHVDTWGHVSHLSVLVAEGHAAAGAMKI